MKKATATSEGKTQSAAVVFYFKFTIKFKQNMNLHLMHHVLYCVIENEIGSSSNSYQSRSKNKGKQPLTDTTNGM